MKHEDYFHFPLQTQCLLFEENTGLPNFLHLQKITLLVKYVRKYVRKSYKIIKVENGIWPIKRSTWYMPDNWYFSK